MKCSIVSAVLLVATALPFSSALPTSDHNLNQHGRVHLDNFGPALHHKTYESGSFTLAPSTFTNALNADPVDIALEFAKAELGASAYVVKNSYTSDHNGVTHVYLRQTHNDLEVVNGDININVDRFGRIISYGDSFYKGKTHTVKAAKAAESKFQDMTYQNSILGRLQRGANVVGQKVFGVQQPKPFVTAAAPLDDFHVVDSDLTVLSPVQALQALAYYIQPVLKDSSVISLLTAGDLPISTTSSLHGDEPELKIHNVPFALAPVPARQAYVQLDDGTLQLVWDLQVEMEDNWFHGQVNAHDGSVVALMDWVSDATHYKVFPFGVNDPSEGSQELLTDPHDPISSPGGWHVQTSVKGRSLSFNETVGNNVYAHENFEGGSSWKNNQRPKGVVQDDGSMIFDYEARVDVDEPKTYIHAAVTNLFYLNNMIHDLFFRYGFNEVAGNFQEENAEGGIGGDAVIANAQDGSGYNNANFATPPDGQHGKMRMYVWNVVSPMRDGDLEAGIVIHEYAHGISTRLTGGPANSGCLGWGEAGGMGEGWGDFFATMIRMNSTHNRDSIFGMGDWANGGDGIRRYKYSTSMDVNPSTYKIMDKPGYWGVHAKGEVWAEMLYEVAWDLIDKHGFTPKLFPPTSASVNKDKKKKPTDPVDDAKRHILSHGNTLVFQLVVDGLKLQPCRPSFMDSRDAIIEADKQLTGGDNFCTIWKAFARRGLGVDARYDGNDWMGVRSESFDAPSQCK
ncbi:Fungalysin metallopeptidase-domain-containing protein [Umbelopsis sp. AD052]|nr:Fungalysin metallopeptidase-domain-containing protein [Umbelopsis sp. AD052]